MTPAELENLKYPIGNFIAVPEFSDQIKQECFNNLKQLPDLINLEYNKLTNANKLDTPYRPEGWTGRQVIHHISDSHLNALIRIKLTLTEPHPTIKPYIESEWAKLKDTTEMDPMVSINLLVGIHSKLLYLYESLNENEFNLTYFHPQMKRDFKLSTMLELYSWHGKHHLEHLRIINKST